MKVSFALKSCFDAFPGGRVGSTGTVKLPTGAELGKDKKRYNGELIKHKHKINKAINKLQQSYSIELAKQIAVENEALKKNRMIPPRSCENVQFTKHEFLHPVRESKKAE